MIVELAGEFAGRAKVAKLNVRQNHNLAQQYEIAVVPTILLFHKGRVVDRQEGTESKGTLAARIERRLGK